MTDDDDSFGSSDSKHDSLVDGDEPEPDPPPPLDALRDAAEASGAFAAASYDLKKLDRTAALELLRSGHEHQFLEHDALGYTLGHYAAEAVRTDSLRVIGEVAGAEALSRPTAGGQLTCAHILTEQGSRTAGVSEAMQILVEFEAALDVSDSGGQTPLHYAAGYGDVELVKLLATTLIEREDEAALVDLDDVEGACLTAIDHRGENPAHKAAAAGHVAVLQAMRKLHRGLHGAGGGDDGGGGGGGRRGQGGTQGGSGGIKGGGGGGDGGGGGTGSSSSSCSSSSSKNAGALSACAAGSPKRIGGGGGVPGDSRSAAYLAAAKGHDKVLRALADSDDLDARASLGIRASGGWTTAHAAAGAGHANVLAALDDVGFGSLLAEPDGVAKQDDSQDGSDDKTYHGSGGSNGITPAHVAAEKGHVAALKVIHERAGAATFSAVAADSTFPAWVAAANGHAEVLRLLYERGDRAAKASLAEADANGRTVASAAAGNGHVECLRVLHGLGFAASFAVADKDGWLPAHWACCGRSGKTRDRGSRGSSSRQRRTSGCGGGNDAVIRTIHELGATATLSVADHAGRTPAHIAALAGHEPCLRALHESIAAAVDPMWEKVKYALQAFAPKAAEAALKEIQDSRALAWVVGPSASSPAANDHDGTIITNPRRAATATLRPAARSQRTIIILTGPPASGKDTVAEHIAKAHGLPAISYSNVLRSPVSSFEKMISAKNGKHTDKDVLELIERRAAGLADGFVLVNFPRRLSQAEVLEAWLKENGERLSAVIQLVAADQQVLRSRVTGRWVHTKSGRTYNTNLPKQQPKSVRNHRGPAGSEPPLLDDETGEPLDRRREDTPEKFQQKLDAFHAVVPMLTQRWDSHGTLLKTVDANRPLQLVLADVDRAVLAAKAGNGNGNDGNCNGNRKADNESEDDDFVDESSAAAAKWRQRDQTADAASTSHGGDDHDSDDEHDDEQDHRHRDIGGGVSRSQCATLTPAHLAAAVGAGISESKPHVASVQYLAEIGGASSLMAEIRDDPDTLLPSGKYYSLLGMPGFGRSGAKKHPRR